MAKFIAWVATDKVGSKATRHFTVDDEDLEDMSEPERMTYLDEAAQEALQMVYEWGWDEA